MLTVKGIRITTLTLTREDKGGFVATSNYQLISSRDTVLADQDVGGYNGMKMTPSVETFKALTAFVDAYQKDISALIGLDSE